MEDAAAEMARMEEVESARREQQKISGGGESKKMFRVVGIEFTRYRRRGGGGFFLYRKVEERMELN